MGAKTFILVFIIFIFVCINGYFICVCIYDSLSLTSIFSEDVGKKVIDLV